MRERLRALGLRYVAVTAWRLARVAVQHPYDAIDHIRTQVALARAEAAVEPLPIPRTDEWQGVLHWQFGAPWPCRECASFNDVWADIAAEVTATPAGIGHDADRDLAELIWAIVIHTEPGLIVETGVSRGITSRVVLTALQRLGSGRLVSVDLPPLEEPWRRLVGTAVPRALRGRWTYVRGSSRRRLARAVVDSGPVDLFIHDSLHTPENLAFELRTILPSLTSGGYVVVDDAEMCDAVRVTAPFATNGFLGVPERAKGSVAVVFRSEAMPGP